MPSVAGRTPPNLWPGDATDKEVCSLIDVHLRRLEEHIIAATATQDDGPLRAALEEVERGVTAHRATLARSRERASTGAYDVAEELSPHNCRRERFARWTAGRSDEQVL